VQPQALYPIDLSAGWPEAGAVQKMNCFLLLAEGCAHGLFLFSAALKLLLEPFAKFPLLFKCAELF
jgi:hypothetical protein